MKSKMFKHGPYKFKAYMKPAGKGFEVGMSHGTKTLFVGNFINKAEAAHWFQLMGSEFARFSRKFLPQPNKASAFYFKFITNHLYKNYYDYLDKAFGRHTKNYHREFNRDLKTYNRLHKDGLTREMPYIRKVS